MTYVYRNTTYVTVLLNLVQQFPCTRYTDIYFFGDLIRKRTCYQIDNIRGCTVDHSIKHINHRLGTCRGAYIPVLAHSLNLTPKIRHCCKVRFFFSSASRLRKEMRSLRTRHRQPRVWLGLIGLNCVFYFVLNALNVFSYFFYHNMLH